MDDICNTIHALTSSESFMSGSSKRNEVLNELQKYLCEQSKVIQREVENKAENVLSTLSVDIHTLPICHILAKWIAVSPAHDLCKIMDYGCKFLLNFEPRATEKCPREFIYICHNLCEISRKKLNNNTDEYSTYISRLLYPMKNAMRKFEEDGSAISSIHTIYLRLCLAGKFYIQALEVAEASVFTISKNTCKSLFDVLQYFYYSGLIFIKLKDFLKSKKCFSKVLTFSSAQVSQIQIDAWEKYFFVCILLFEDIPSFPLYTSKVVILGIQNSNSSAFLDAFSKAIHSKNVKNMKQIVEDYKDELKSKFNYGLANKAIKALEMMNLRRLSRVYSRTTLKQISNHLNLKDNEHAYFVLFSMIIDGGIKLKIDPIKDIINFDLKLNYDKEEDEHEELMNRINLSLANLCWISNTIGQVELKLLSSDKYKQKLNHVKNQLTFDKLTSLPFAQRHEDDNARSLFMNENMLSTCYKNQFISQITELNKVFQDESDKD